MKKLIILLAILCMGCWSHEYEMIMTTEMLDSYVGKKHVPELKKEFRKMGIYGGSFQTPNPRFKSPNPRFKFCGYVDSVYSIIYFTVDGRNLILSYDVVKK